MALPEDPAEAPPHLVMRKATGAGRMVLVIGGTIDRAHIKRLCDRVGAFLEDSADHTIVCDVSALVSPDVVAVDALARLQLTVQRSGHRIQLQHACSELRELLSFTGLDDAVPLLPGSSLEARGEPEEGEEPGGVQEEADPGDPVP